LSGFEAEGAASVAGGQEAGAALAEPADQAVLRLELEVAEWKDRALRAAADLDNYRKRAIREREEMHGRGQADVLARVIEVIDDLARVAHLDPEQTTAQALHEGMLQIERKFLKVLEAAGVERIDPLGERFDPNAHEAVLTLPASSPEADHTVGTVLQHGYRFRGVLLRPARVGVWTWSAPEDDVSGEGTA
jgi:molecular chaperone GrpE